MGVVGGIAAQGLTWLFEQFGVWVFDWIFGALSKFAQAVLDLTSSAASVFWEVPVITVFLDFSEWVNIAVLVIALLFLIMDIVEQSGRVNWGTVFLNLCRGLVFVAFNRYIGLATYVISEQITSAMRIQMSVPSAAGIVALLGPLTSGVLSIVMLLVILAAVVSFFVMSMVRNGTLFVQILSSSFYIPAIVRGDTARLNDWLRQTVAISATYLFQYILFYIGLNYMTGLTGQALVTTGTCWLTMFFVPKILERFGYASGAGSVMSMAGNAASMGMSFAK